MGNEKVMKQIMVLIYAYAIIFSQYAFANEVDTLKKVLTEEVPNEVSNGRTNERSTVTPKEAPKEAPQEASKQSAFTFQQHPLAQIFAQSTKLSNDYIIALDKYKKTDNRWVPEKWQREAGKLTRYTIEMPRDYPEEDIFTFYREQLPDSSELLFGCKGRQCGESNNWANDHFGVKQLYGTNSSQFYSVFRIPYTAINGSDMQGSISYVTIYTVRRGNRRLYTQLDVLLVPAKNQ